MHMRACTSSITHMLQPVPACRYIQLPVGEGLIKRDPEPPRRLHLLHGREHIVRGKKVWLLRFEEVATREAADSLRNFQCEPLLVSACVL